MASTEGGNPAHRMKRTGGGAQWRVNQPVFQQPYRPSVEDDTGEMPIPMITSDILPPAKGPQNGPPTETPVPIPVFLRAPDMTYTAPAPAAKQKSMAMNEKIMQAQREWEKNKAIREDQAPTAPSQQGHTNPQTHANWANPSTRRDSAEFFETLPHEKLVPEAGAMPGLKRLPEEALLQEMTELNRPANGGPRRRSSRANTDSSSASASAYESASASPSEEALPSDAGDAMDTGDGDSPRTGLQANADGVSYYEYTEDDGSKHNTGNAPVITGQERYQDESGRLQFICPVRDCRVLTPTRKGLAAHFHGKHSKSLFNDNGDGTFSKVGDYLNEGRNSSPGIVVSRNHLPPGAPPPEVPEYSEHHKKLFNKKITHSPRTIAAMAAIAALPRPDTSKRSLRSNSSNEVLEESIPKRPKSTPVPLPVQVTTLPPLPPIAPQIPQPSHSVQSSEPPMTDVLRYLHSCLSLSQQVPDRLDVKALSEYPRVRRLPGSWLEYHFGKTLDPLQYACILAYLVGKAEEINPCERWKGVSRLSQPCVRLPPDLPAEARNAFSKSETCVACQYQLCCYRAKNECEWANEGRNLDGEVGEEVSQQAPQQNHQSAVRESEKVVVLDDDDAGTKVDDTTLLLATKQSHDLFSSMKRPDKQPEQTLVESSEKMSPPLATTAPPASAVQKPSPAKIAEMEEMEDWEVAPGTIKDGMTNTNIGFSNAYMSSPHPITISPGLGFNVLTLKPGHPYHWPIQASMVRLCSVSAGKISVKMGNEEEFKLGPNGLIIIRSGQSCRVTNRLYSDAVLHCTTFEDYF